MLEILNDNANPSEDTSDSTAETTSLSSVASTPLELTRAAVVEFLLANNGKVKYAELFNHFRDLIADCHSGFSSFFLSLPLLSFLLKQINKK